MFCLNESDSVLEYLLGKYSIGRPLYSAVTFDLRPGYFVFHLLQL